MQSRSFRYFTPIAVALTLAMGGCATTGSVSDQEEDVAAVPQAASEARLGPDGRFGPPRGHELFAVALHEIDLSAEQRITIEGALEKLRSEDHGGMKAFHTALAEGVRAGKIDEDALKAKVAELEQQAGAHRTALAKALETLHGTLTPEQRGALVAHIEERMQHRPGHDGKGPGPHGPMGARGPHGPDGMQHGPHGPMGARGPHGPDGMRHGPMGFLLHDLDLTEEQRTQIKSALDVAMPDKPGPEEMAKKHEEMRARAKAVLDAFKGDKFDANAALPQKAGDPPFVHMVTAMKAIVPVLDAGQRDRLADRLEQGPARHPHGRRGHGPRGESAEAQ